VDGNLERKEASKCTPERRTAQTAYSLAFHLRAFCAEHPLRVASAFSRLVVVVLLPVIWLYCTDLFIESKDICHAAHSPVMTSGIHGSFVCEGDERMDSWLGIAVAAPSVWPIVTALGWAAF